MAIDLEGASASSFSFWSQQGETLASLRESNTPPKEAAMSDVIPAAVPTWIYPIGDGEPKIIDLPPDAAAPAGFVFSPADVTKAATAPVARKGRAKK